MKPMDSEAAPNETHGRSNFVLFGHKKRQLRLNVFKLSAGKTPIASAPSQLHSMEF